MSEDAEAAYALEFTEDALEDLGRLDKPAARRITKKMRWVADNATLVQHEALTGEWAGYFRWRIGEYRAIYELDHDGKLLIVAVVGHRREVYDN